MGLAWWLRPAVNRLARGSIPLSSTPHASTDARGACNRHAGKPGSQSDQCRFCLWPCKVLPAFDFCAGVLLELARVSAALLTLGEWLDLLILRHPHSSWPHPTTGV